MRGKVLHVIQTCIMVLFIINNIKIGYAAQMHKKDKNNDFLTKCFQ